MEIRRQHFGSLRVFQTELRQNEITGNKGFTVKKSFFFFVSETQVSCTPVPGRYVTVNGQCLEFPIFDAQSEKSAAKYYKKKLEKKSLTLIIRRIVCTRELVEIKYC